MSRQKRIKGKDNPTSFSKRLTELILRETGRERRDDIQKKELNRIASEMGVNGDSLDKWMDNASAPTSDYIPKIVNYFGVSFDYMMGVSDDPSRTPSGVDELGLSPEAVSSLSEWKRDNPEYLRIINALISDPGFVYALDDLANGLYLASVESGKDSDFADFQWKESEKAVEQIAKLTVDGELTPYKEAFIKVRDNLDLSDCAEIYRQKGIREITYILDMMK